MAKFQRHQRLALVNARGREVNDVHRILNLDVEMVDPAEINGCGDPLADREEVHVALVVLDLEALEEG